jgi:glucose/arabinose dehydrogenase
MDARGKGKRARRTSTLGALLYVTACSQVNPTGQASDDPLGVLGLALAGAAAELGGNSRPATPIILEPEVGRIFNPGNVHMETAPFSDLDAGDDHRCTDWEIWTVAPPVDRAWVTSCIGGPLRLHTHLGDGIFEGSHQRRRQLFPEADYSLRVRHRDGSGDPETEWSEWSERAFRTGALSEVFSMLVSDVKDAPAPELRSASGDAPILLANGLLPALLRLEGAQGQPLVTMRGGPLGNQTVNEAPFADHVAVRIVIGAGSSLLELPASNFAFTSEEGIARTIYLPAVTLAAGASEAFWIADNGGTYTASGSAEPVFAVLRREADVPWTVSSDLEVDIAAQGLTLPVSIAFIPNPGSSSDSPLFYVVELYGTIKVVRRNGIMSDYATDILNYTPSNVFPGSGEQGLGSAVVDPENGDVFVTLVYGPTPEIPGAPLYGAVDRLSSTDGGRTASSHRRVLDMQPEIQAPAHQPSNVTFGPDGYLYVHTGDGLIPESSQDLAQFRGKILRMTRAGAAVHTNPYYNARDGITARDYVYASGFRNAWGGAWRTSDKSHYFVENGPGVDRMARLVAGRNYGWDGGDPSMYNYAIYTWVPSTSPANITFLQTSTFGRSGFPSSYDGRAYITEFCCGVGPGWSSGKVITEWLIDADGNLTEGRRPVATYNGSGAATPVAIAAGPDGLYFSDLFGDAPGEIGIPTAKIMRLRYRAPTAGPDCNGNGVDDAEDLKAGTSQDCNFNAIADDCDTATGRSEDCNANANPDECEVGQASSFDFSRDASLFNLNGTAESKHAGVLLTPALGGSMGSVVLAPLSEVPLERLRAEFDFRMGAGSGADGLSFAAFDAAIYPTTLIFGEDGPGPRSLVVKFNTYDNGDGANTIQILLNGQAIAVASPGCKLNDYRLHTARLQLEARRLNLIISCRPGVLESVFQDLELPGFEPFVGSLGFGARTGGLADEHWIERAVFWVPGENDSDGDGVLDTCQGG